MCLILLAHRIHPEYPLVFAANRDEFYARPTAPAGYWDDAPEVLAGRDLQAGGTWMGITPGGRWAAVTNYRDLASERPGARSRGELVSQFLRSRDTPEAYLRQIADRAAEYNGFNLLVADREQLWYFSNRGGEPRELGPGVYGLSNHLLDTPWPKVVRGKQALSALLEDGAAPAPEPLFEILADADPAPEAELPETGVGREWERALSSLFIATPTYGTRASTVLLIDHSGRATFVERTFSAGSPAPAEISFQFEIR
ncbi:MAG TPA: NRDE family protein [Longimicrobiaceae bacterium]|nr:NRDE family protein [Longimicrobiaceae bacterium]